MPHARSDPAAYASCSSTSCPNVLAQVIVYTTLLIPVVIVVQATLSYLGLGLPPPTPDWGGMISTAQNYYTVAWWYIVFPGAALVITTLSFNLFGDGVRDAFDPRAGAQQRR
jgi:peptide/nickel transport system permease protein